MGLDLDLSSNNISHFTDNCITVAIGKAVYGTPQIESYWQPTELATSHISSATSFCKRMQFIRGCKCTFITMQVLACRLHALSDLPTLLLRWLKFHTFLKYKETFHNRKINRLDREQYSTEDKEMEQKHFNVFASINSSIFYFFHS